ncbi:hypothetical protein BgiBS90_019285 [Biomphalaria glabrata]|nr:hypothetical protein BgiBS90_019285 [Biomphalaria glabrata]
MKVIFSFVHKARLFTLLSSISNTYSGLVVCLQFGAKCQRLSTTTHQDRCQAHKEPFTHCFLYTCKGSQQRKHNSLRVCDILQTKNEFLQAYTSTTTIPCYNPLSRWRCAWPGHRY